MVGVLVDGGRFAEADDGDEKEVLRLDGAPPATRALLYFLAFVPYDRFLPIRVSPFRISPMRWAHSSMRSGT